MSYIEIKDLVKKYNDNVVLKNVTIDINKGEFVLIYGQSGSGKTTLLNLLALIDSVTSGNIIIDGKNISEMTLSEGNKFRKQYISMIFQDYKLLQFMNIKDNILLPIYLKNEEFVEDKYENVISILNIDKLVKQKTSTLSGGEQQRVSIARALMSETPIILADEPTGNLDVQNGIAVFELLKKINEEIGTTVIVATHNPDYVKYATKVLRLKNGMIYYE